MSYIANKRLKMSTQILAEKDLNDCINLLHENDKIMHDGLINERFALGEIETAIEIRSIIQLSLDKLQSASTELSKKIYIVENISAVTSSVKLITSEVI